MTFQRFYKRCSLALVVGSLSMAPGCCSGSSFDSQIHKLQKSIEAEKHSESVNYGRLQGANDKLETYLLKTASNGALLNAALPGTKTAMWVTDSRDRKLRVYSWDMETGGTMHNYDAVAQYRAGKVVHGERFGVTPTDDAGMYYPEIKTYSTKSGGTVYVVSGIAIGSPVEYGGQLQAFVIKDGKLQKAKFFKTSKKLLDSISFSCEATNAADLTAGFDFKNNDRVLQVPIIDKDLHDTERYLIYKFDGEKFVFSGSRG